MTDGQDQAGATERRQQLIKVASAVAFLAVAAVVVLIVISGNETEGGDSSNLEGLAEVERELKGIPQEGMLLGDASAKVTVLEFADLQCPVCKGYSEEVLPQVIENWIRSGEARLSFRNFTIIDEDSIAAGAAAIAAGKQGRGWNFVELFYRNQGIEHSGYATDEFLTAIAEAAGVPDVSRWNSDRKSKAVLAEVEQSTSEAQQLGFNGTPSFAIEGPGTKGLEALGTPESVGALESAISAASAAK